MKTLGLIGGISWVSTLDYYKNINLGINQKLGGLNFSKCLIHSFNYADIKKNNDANDWESTFNMIAEASMNLKLSGAEGIVLCANTMHYIADRLEQQIELPVIHIGTATANAIKQQGAKKVGLIGTKFTMELDFFKDKLKAQGIEPIIPDDQTDRDFIHYIIFEELGRGIVSKESKEHYLAIVNKMIEQEEIEGLILGCTEIPLLIKPEDLDISCFDTTLIHSDAAVEFALS